MSSFANVKYWFFLACAVIFEVGGTSVMKLSQISESLFGEYAGLGIMFVLIALSYYFLSLAVKGLPVGVAYAFWEGLGLTLITLVSVLVVGESMSMRRFLALLAVLGGALLIHHGTTATPARPETDQRGGNGVCSGLRLRRKDG